MSRITLQVTIVVFLLFAAHAVVAQDVITKITPPATAPVITGTAAAERLRFTAPNTIIQMQLRIYADSGQMLFDVTSEGNVLDWTLQDSGGERLIPGSYLCVVTVKSLSGKLSQRIGSALVQEKQVELQGVDARQFTPAQQQAVGPIEENGALTILKAEEAQATTVLANNGTEGQMIRGRGALTFRVGDFFSGNDREQMRLTEDGRLGIGTRKPQATLDVAGMIRASKGFLFSNGSTLNVNDNGALTLTSSNGNIVPNVAGTGTTNQVTKWTDNSGTLGDSTITEVGGRVGIGVNNPTYRLVVGPDIGPGLTTSDLTISRGPGQSVSIFAGATGAHGMNFGWDEANQRAFVNAPVQSPITFTHGGVSERMRIETNGNIGIGTNAPGAKLHVAAAAQAQLDLQDTVTGGTPAGGSRWRIFADNVGGGGGNLTFGFFDVTNGALRLGVDNSGKVGIGTAAPTQKLEVAGNVKVSGNGNGFMFPDGTSMTTAGATLGANTFTGDQSVTGTISATGAINTNTQYNIGGSRVLSVPGQNNVFAGVDAGQSNSGPDNSFFGKVAGFSNTTGFNNSFFGSDAGQANSTGCCNSFFGTLSGFSNTTGNSNSFFGNAAGSHNTTGNSNIFIGDSSGISNNAEDNNTFIGVSSNGVAGITNATAVGFQAKVTQSNSLVLGNSVNVGIGTGSPSAKLSVVAAGSTEITGAAQSSTFRTTAGTLGNTAGDELSLASIGFLNGNNTSLGIRGRRITSGTSWTTSAIGLGMDVDDTVRAGDATLWLHANGNVGIGISSPTHKLEVNGSVAGIGPYQDISDVRFKKNIYPLSGALNKVLHLRGVSFDWRSDEFPALNFSKGRQVGFIAQEMVGVLPEAVTRDDKGYYRMAYSEVTPVLVEAIKEQQLQLDRKDAEILTLKAANASMNVRISKVEQIMRGFKPRSRRSSQKTRR